MKSIQLLGCRVVEKTTGYAGVVTSVSYDLVGCVMAYITPPVDKKNNGPTDGRWYDVSRLEVGKRVMPAPQFAELGQTSPALRGPSAKTSPNFRPA